MRKNRSDRGGPHTEPANDFVGRVSAEGRIQDFGACWQWLDDVEHLRDLVEPRHQARIDRALAAAVSDGAAEIDAGFRAGGTPFRWRFQRTGKGFVHVVADPIDPDPVTGHAIAEGVSTGVALSDTNGRLQYVNAACAAIWAAAAAICPGAGWPSSFARGTAQR